MGMRPGTRCIVLMAAPEVIRGQGYGFGCDWWSLGVISESASRMSLTAVYESLYGYPPFVSSSRHVTRQKMYVFRTTHMTHTLLSPKS